VDEYVRRAVVGGDETEPLVGVEPLHGSLSHLLSPSRDEPVIRAVARIGWVARRRNEVQANGAAPTAKTAGAFTIANFDNSLSGQCIRWPADF
jgi:hypothetical protein